MSALAVELPFPDEMEHTVTHDTLSGRVRSVCPCGWVRNTNFVQGSDLARRAALTAALYLGEWHLGDWGVQ